MIEGDILYFDLLYNVRQYGVNYYLLNIIVKMDIFVFRGVIGLWEYYKSDYCKVGKVLESFKELIENV